MTNYNQPLDINSRLDKAHEYYLNAKRPCCPAPFPDYVQRHPLLEQISGNHPIPSPPMPFWWSENVLNAPQLRKFPWLKEVLDQVTWQEMIEGKI